MIPLCLNLRNFMSYTDVHEPLRFEGIHVAVLSGDNGHGKSALLDAITWALWGQSRARGEDELIHTGATEMEVEFEFLLDGDQYRVIRKRQKRGKQSIPDLQFTVLSNGVYRPLTERSVRETERAIQRTLKMSYETFTSSSFIQQGKADNFTTSLPAERKRILAEILELGYYDELEARAKEELRQHGQQLGEEQARSREWEQEIARRPEIEGEVERLKGELAVLEERTHALEAGCNLTRERVARLEASVRALAECEERIARHTAERERVRAAYAQAESSLKDARSVLERADGIESAAKELAETRAALEACDLLQQKHTPLARERDQLEGVLGAEKARLEAHLAATSKALPELRALVKELPQLRREREERAGLAEELGTLADRQVALQTEAIRCREDAAEKRTVNRQMKARMLELKQRIEGLAGLQTCPACQRPMDPTHKAKLQAAYEAEGAALAAEFRVNEKVCKELDARVAAHDGELRALEARLKARDETQRALANLEQRLAQAIQAEGRLGTLTGELAEVEERLKSARYASESRQRLADVNAQLKKLAYDEERHVRLRERVRELAAAEAESQKLERARTAAEHLEQRITESKEATARLEKELATEEARATQLRQDRTQLETERAKLKEVEASLAGARAERDRTRDQHSQGMARLDYAHFAEKRLAESMATQDRLRREQGLYAELATAFGKKGVQAMVIETAIPEIEREANALLSRLTDGRMNVSLETRRDTRSGSGTIETLDIKIADELGTRNYEMFSGGEGFRVNFSIRIALSKLLAQRAGTRLQTLVVDEGFGSQDAEGLDRIVEVIQAIQGEFEKILVITHLEELRDRFPVRIDVRKTPQGSVVNLR